MKSFFTHFLPLEASSYAKDVDTILVFLILLCGTVFAGIFVTIILFSIRYRRKPGIRPELPHRNNARLEMTWTVLSLFIFVGIFSFTVNTYLKAETPPEEALEMLVVGKQWMWKFQHLEGPRELGAIHVPLGSPIRLLMISQDVIHSLYLPEFRIKQDVLPGRYTQLWFKPEHLGTFHVRCAEYCGTDHSRMDATVTVMKPEDFASWLDANRTLPSLAAEGQTLFESYGCGSCHSEANIDKAPLLWGDYDQTIDLDGGQSIKVDDNYLRESILDSGAKKRAGYRSIMPTYAGRLSEEQVLALITYIKSVHGARRNSLREAHP